jgi:hypothetical protein
LCRQNIPSSLSTPEIASFWKEKRFAISHLNRREAGHETSAGRQHMGELFTPQHLMVLAVITVLLFGGKNCRNSRRSWERVFADSKME